MESDDDKAALRRRLAERLGIVVPTASVPLARRELTVTVTHLDGRPPSTHRVGVEGAWIGRAAEAAIRLPQDDVSSAHAYIGLDASGFFVVDQSRNGTYLGEESEDARLTPGERVHLADGQRLVIGDFVLMLQESATGSLAPVPRQDPGRNMQGETPAQDAPEPEIDPFERMQRMRERGT